MPRLELCWHWLSIRLFNSEITIRMCLMLESRSKIKGGKRKHILFPNPVGKTPTQCFFSSIVFTTQPCWSFKSNSKLKLGLIFFSNIVFIDSAIFPMCVYLSLWTTSSYFVTCSTTWIGYMFSDEIIIIKLNGSVRKVLVSLLLNVWKNNNNT